MKEFGSPQELAEVVGSSLGPSDVFVISQEMVNKFGALTQDCQWIHVDVERATEGPFGGPVAHGFLLLSLIPRFLSEIVIVKNCRVVLNNGLSNVEFVSAVRVGSAVRATAKVRRTQLGRRGSATVTLDIEVWSASSEVFNDGQVALKAGQTLTYRSGR